MRGKYVKLDTWTVSRIRKRPSDKVAFNGSIILSLLVTKPGWGFFFGFLSTWVKMNRKGKGKKLMKILPMISPEIMDHFR